MGVGVGVGVTRIAGLGVGTGVATRLTVGTAAYFPAGALAWLPPPPLPGPLPSQLAAVLSRWVLGRPSAAAAGSARSWVRAWLSPRTQARRRCCRLRGLGRGQRFRSRYNDLSRLGLGQFLENQGFLHSHHQRFFGGRFHSGRGFLLVHQHLSAKIVFQYTGTPEALQLGLFGHRVISETYPSPAGKRRARRSYHLILV
jgi:hypothetical protein